MRGSGSGCVRCMDIDHRARRPLVRRVPRDELEDRSRRASRCRRGRRCRGRRGSARARCTAGVPTACPVCVRPGPRPAAWRCRGRRASAGRAGGHHEVVGLDVAVDDPLRVRDGERGHGMADEEDGVALWKRNLPRSARSEARRRTPSRGSRRLPRTRSRRSARCSDGSNAPPRAPPSGTSARNRRRRRTAMPASSARRRGRARRCGRDRRGPSLRRRGPRGPRNLRIAARRGCLPTSRPGVRRRYSSSSIFRAFVRLMRMRLNDPASTATSSWLLNRDLGDVEVSGRDRVGHPREPADGAEDREPEEHVQEHEDQDEDSRRARRASRGSPATRA